MATTKMTRKGQVTIPAEIRERLHLAEGDRFVVMVHDGDVVLRSERSIVASTAGMLGVGNPPLIPPTKEARHEAFIQAIVDDYLDSRKRDDA